MYLQVREMTTQDSIHCYCNHLSAFGGQLLVAPTPIDFDKVFTELAGVPDSGYIAVMIAVSCVFGLYLLLLMWARKNDKRDLMKVRTYRLIIINVPWTNRKTGTRKLALSGLQVTDSRLLML